MIHSATATTYPNRSLLKNSQTTTYLALSYSLQHPTTAVKPLTVDPATWLPGRISKRKHRHRRWTLKNTKLASQMLYRRSVTAFKVKPTTTRLLQIHCDMTSQVQKSKRRHYTPWLLSHLLDRTTRRDIRCRVPHGHGLNVNIALQTMTHSSQPPGDSCMYQQRTELQKDRSALRKREKSLSQREGGSCPSSAGP